MEFDIGPGATMAVVAIACAAALSTCAIVGGDRTNAIRSCSESCSKSGRPMLRSAKDVCECGPAPAATGGAK